MDGILIPYITRVKQVFFPPTCGVFFHPFRQMDPGQGVKERQHLEIQGSSYLWGSKATTDPGRWAPENQSYKGPYNSTDFEVV